MLLDAGERRLGEAGDGLGASVGGGHFVFSFGVLVVVGLAGGRGGMLDLLVVRRVREVALLGGMLDLLVVRRVREVALLGVVLAGHDWFSFGVGRDAPSGRSICGSMKSDQL